MPASEDYPVDGPGRLVFDMRRRSRSSPHWSMRYYPGDTLLRGKKPGKRLWNGHTALTIDWAPEAGDAGFRGQDRWDYRPATRLERADWGLAPAALVAWTVNR